MLTNRLEDLAECGFIRKYLPVGGVNGGIYQLIDNFTLFYMRFVRGNTSRDGDHWTDGVSQGEKNEWRGFAFERLCLEHTAQIKRALGISGVHTDVYSWKCSASAELRGAQIDLLLVRRDGIVNLCEMKYSAHEYAIDAEEDAKIARPAYGLRMGAALRPRRAGEVARGLRLETDCCRRVGRGSYVELLRRRGKGKYLRLGGWGLSQDREVGGDRLGRNLDAVLGRGLDRLV